MQCAAVVAAAMALARPSVRLHGEAERPWLLLRDVSASTRGQDSNCATWPAEVRRHTADFADRVLAPGETPGDPASRGFAAASTRTLIRPALHWALARAGDSGGVVVLSDGQWHDEDWDDAADALRRAGLPVLVIPLAAPPRDARITDLRARRRADGKVDLAVSVAANAPQKRTLSVRRDGLPAPLLEKELQLLEGDSLTIRLEDDPGAGTATYRAALGGSAPAIRPPSVALATGGQDVFPENDQAAAAVPPRQALVAVVSGSGTIAPEGLARLMQAGVEAVKAPSAAEGWNPYSAVVLVDETGSLLDLAQRSALERYVREGGGLVVVGTGPYASSADRQDPLNRAAALAPNPFERKPLRVIVVLDSSGSMSEAAGPAGGSAALAAGGRRKFDLAVEAVMSLKSHLTDRDSLAVIVFSDTPRRVYDSATAPPDFAALREALAKIQPGGPTVLAPALEEATAGATPAGRDGLVIVASDLAVQPFDEERMAGRFRQKKLSLSVVAIEHGGEKPSRESVAILSRLLGGPLVAQDDLAGLASVFERFLRQARGEAVRRGEFRLAASEPPFGRDVSPLAADAYVLSAPQRGAEVLASIGGDPVLARRSVGLGRSVSLALPVSATSNAPLRTSQDFLGLVAAAAEWSLRPADDPRFSGDIRWRGDELLLRIEAAQGGSPINLLNLVARAAQPGQGEERSGFPLEQTAPGHYEAAIPHGGGPAAPAGPIVVQVSEPGGRPLWRGAFADLYAPEFAGIGPRWPNLRRLAARTGGRIVEGKDLPVVQRQRLRQGYVAIGAWLLALAAAIMLAEWALVRVTRR